jgi:hypothetical protein
MLRLESLQLTLQNLCFGADGTARNSQRGSRRASGTRTGRGGAGEGQSDEAGSQAEKHP